MLTSGNKEIELGINQYRNAHNATKFGAMQPNYKSSAYFLALSSCVSLLELLKTSSGVDMFVLCYMYFTGQPKILLISLCYQSMGQLLVKKGNTPFHFNTEHFYFCWFYMKQISTPTSKFHFDKLFEIYYKIHKRKQASLSHLFMSANRHCSISLSNW